MSGDFRSGRVQTVLGLVEPEELGSTQTHEHLFVDLSFFFEFPYVRGVIEALPEEQRAHVDEPIRLDNVYWVRRYLLNRDNLRLTDQADAIEEMRRYRAAGGGALVEATPSSDIGRNPKALRAISEETGVHIIMGSGHYVAAVHPPEVRAMPTPQLAEAISQDVLEGADGSGVRSGVIGEIGLGWPIHPDEEKVLRAALFAQEETGVALLIHPGVGAPDAPFAAMKVVSAAGGDPSRAIMCHIDQTVFNPETMIELATTGCYLEFDLFGHEWSYHPIGPDMPNDATKIDYLLSLIEAGYHERLLISQDIATKAHLTKYGGEGYTHILNNVVPLMRHKGMSDDLIHTILVENPRRVLTIR